MRKLYAATTALTLVLAGPLAAYAADMAEYTPTGDEIRASEFIGTRVYTVETDIHDQTAWSNWDGDRTDWDDVGEIGDVLMTREGQVQAILVDVGGFLGVGEKEVALPMTDLKLLSDKDNQDDMFVVFTASKEMLTNAAGYRDPEDRQAENANASGHTAAQDTMAADKSAAPAAAATHDNAAKTDATAKADADATAPATTAPEFKREGFAAADSTFINSEHLTGARVYDMNDKWIGEVAELNVAEGGKVENAVLEVGGFLGLGEKRVQVDFDTLNVQKQTNGEEMRVYIDATKQSLLDMPTYNDPK